MFDDEEKFYRDEKTKFVALLNSLGWSEEHLLHRGEKSVGENDEEVQPAERRGPTLFEVSARSFDADETSFFSVQTVRTIIESAAEGVESADQATNAEQFP